MDDDSAIDAATLAAYRATDYLVFGEIPLTLRIDESNADLAALHAAAQVHSSAFISACNPYSQPLGDAQNASRQAALASLLQERGYSFIDGSGQLRDDDWCEPSFLVLGIALPEAREFGARFEQNAILWCEADGVPRLKLLR